MGITSGCTSSIAVSNVTVIITPTLTTSNDVTIFNGEQTVLSVSGNASIYSWTPSTNLSCSTCTNPIASPKTTIQYCVRGAQQTCTTSACVTVNVEAACFTNTDYSTPNAFTPNNDGNNDTYNLLGWKECITVFYIAIYDRWGEKVFDSDDVTFNWDGTYRGKLLDPAVYVYYIKAEAIRAGSIYKKGNITLIR